MPSHSAQAARRRKPLRMLMTGRSPMQRLADETVLIKVPDRGPGIPESQWKRS